MMGRGSARPDIAILNSPTSGIPNWRRAPVVHLRANPILAFLLVLMLTLLPTASPLLAQQSRTQPAASANSGSSEPGQAPPSRLKIEVLTALPLAEPAGALSANSLHVRITDEWGMPVRGATVSFRLPEAGPGGVFLNGLSSEIAITDERGEAAVKGFDWRAEAGVTFIHVIAAYGSVRAGGMAEVQLTRSAGVTRTPRGQPPPPLPSTSQPSNVTAATPEVLGRTETAAAPALPRPSTTSVREQTPPAPPPYPAPDISPRRDAYSPPEPAAEASDGSADRDASMRARDAAEQSYVRVKRGGANGSNKMLTILLVVGAAAGGAIAVGLSGGSSAGASQPGGPAAVAPIRIGNPTISVGTAGVPR